jgi:putative tryptophan/tyrosine transport system substrate-binding protein
MKRRAFITLISGLAIAWPLASYAQQPKQSLKRVGVLPSTVPCPLPPDHPIVRRLGELGWIEGQNFVFECISGVGHYGHLDQLAALARELVSRRPDVLMAGPIPFVGALKQETTTIPIVMLGTSVMPDLVTNLARPEGNITGVSTFQGGIMPKRVEILKEMVPQLRRLALIAATAEPKSIEGLEKAITFVAGKLGFAWQRFQPIVANDYDEIFARLAAEHFDAAYIGADPLSTQNSARIGQLALRHRIPTVAEFREWAKNGLLLTYGQDGSWSTARAMDYVDKILRGAKPGDLPVEQATKIDLVINLKTAKELGLTIPPSLIARADEVIE